MSLKDLISALKGFEGHAGRPGQVGGSKPRGGSGAKLKSINTLQHVINLGREAEHKGETLFIRWSRGPALDKKQGASLDYTTYQRHNGLSAQHIRFDNPELLAQMIPEYKFLRRKDDKIFPWIFTGHQNGVDSDNAPTVDAASIKPVGKISDELIKKCEDYSWAYRAHRQHYSYNPDGRAERIEKNAKLDSDLKKAWAALNG